MRLERRAEEPRNGAREGTGGRSKKRARITGATTTVANPERRGTKRCSRSQPPAAGRCRYSADLSTERNVREADGSSRGRRELPAGAGGGETQPGSSGNRSNDYGATGAASSSELVDTPRQTAEGYLCPEPSEAGRDTEAERGHADVRNPDGTGSVHPAVATASADTDLRTGIQRAQLRVSARTERAGRGASRTAVCAGREGLGGGHRHHEVLRPRQPRHTDGPGRERDPGQTSVAIDGEVPAAGSNGGRVGGGQRGRDAARWPVVTAAGKHLSGCAR